ncbi:hypothetical protein [Streptomyces sp. NPDC051665]|uniref:hypothetical protein n=1 Tax=Streptomyces sp. NPDC051665 TaxID=3154647 RepID=UPI0034285814
MTYQRQPMISFTVTLSNDKTIKVSAPSAQRARDRVIKLLEERESTLTIKSVDRT